jgi:predicted RNase H-like HicB family nuclease
MTQVISSCAARGYTPEEAMEMYQALSSLTELGISEYIDSFKEYFKNPNKEENKDAFQKAITDTIVDALVH